MKAISKASLLLAFFTGTPLEVVNLKVVNKVEREDGSNNSYNITGITNEGKQVTQHVRTY